MEYDNIDSIIGGFNKILSIPTTNVPTQIPTILIFSGVPLRSGLSAIKIASRIINRKSEAGLNVGVLPSGTVSPDEIMERIRIEEIIKALQQESIISVAIPPGITINASGISPTGPVTVVGASVTYVKGFGIIQ